MAMELQAVVIMVAVVVYIVREDRALPRFCLAANVAVVAVAVLLLAQMADLMQAVMVAPEAYIFFITLTRRYQLHEIF